MDREELKEKLKAYCSRLFPGCVVEIEDVEEDGFFPKVTTANGDKIPYWAIRQVMDDFAYHCPEYRQLTAV